MAEPQIAIPQEQVVDFCRRNQIRTFSLFGPVLRDGFGPDSDVDVLIEFEPEARVGFMALGRMQRELAELLGRRADLVPREGLKPRIRDSVLGSAQVFYAA
jgi:predicted nucleotidyltransferase